MRHMEIGWLRNEKSRDSKYWHCTCLSFKGKEEKRGNKIVTLRLKDSHY